MFNANVQFSMSNSIDDPLIGCITQFHPHKYTYMRYHVAAKRLAKRCSSLGSCYVETRVIPLAHLSGNLKSESRPI